MSSPPASSDKPATDWLEPLESFEAATNTFVVVIRSPGGHVANGEPVPWRGSVEHAQSHVRIYFVEYSRLNEFITAHCGTPAPPQGWQQRLALHSNKIGSRLLKHLKIVGLPHSILARPLPVLAQEHLASAAKRNL